MQGQCSGDWDARRVQWDWDAGTVQWGLGCRNSRVWGIGCRDSAVGVGMQNQCSGSWDAETVQWGLGCRDSAVGELGCRDAAVGIGPVSTVMQGVCAGLSSAAASGNKAVMHVAQQQTKTSIIINRLLKLLEDGR